jgi:hypothetical protein
MSRRHHHAPPTSTPADDKRLIIERILRAWQRTPNMRLGQLISSAMYARGNQVGGLGYVDDDTMATILELYASAPPKDEPIAYVPTPGEDPFEEGIQRSKRGTE